MAYSGKRCIDLLFSFTLMILLFPLFCAIGIILRLDSRGPVFFKARRIGRFGTPFDMWKFRTMVDKANLMGPGLTEQSDERITAIGSILRRTSIDELPQLINVIKGEMSIVGPRPEISEIVSNYTKGQKASLLVLPGITGMSQINGRDDLPLEPKLEFENYYVKNMSLWLDLKIILLTIPAVVKGRGVRY